MVIDADGHVIETEEIFQRYLAAEYQHLRPRLILDEDGRGGWLIDSQLVPKPRGKGAFLPEELGKIWCPATTEEIDQATFGSQTLSDIPSRLRDLDREGIDVQVLYPSLLLCVSGLENGQLVTAVCHAYNRWLAEVCQHKPDRLKGMAVVTLQDLEGAIREIRHAKELGLVGVLVSGIVGNRRLGAPEFLPFFAEAERLDMPIAVHIGPNCPPLFELSDNHFQNLTSNLMQVMHGFISVLVDGVVERFPRLRVAFMETGCSWLWYWIERMEEYYESRLGEAMGLRRILPRKPSSYLKDGNLYIACEVEEALLPQVVQRCGEDLILFASDYPHPERHPHAARYLQERQDLTASAKRKILGENAARFYRLEQ